MEITHYIRWNKKMLFILSKTVRVSAGKDWRKRWDKGKRERSWVGNVSM
jgi:hypothetical protein